MINACFLLGYPYHFKELCLIYPPKVKDIISNQKYGIYSRILTYSQEELEDEFVENNIDITDMPTPFEYLMIQAYHNTQMKSFIISAFELFIHEPIMFLFEQKAILIGDVHQMKTVNQARLLTEKDYFDFQNILRQALGLNTVEAPNPNEDPRVKAIKAKARYRDKIKAKQNQGINLQTTLASICCMNMGLNPLNIGELSYAALPILIGTYQMKEKYEIDVDSLLAGADSKKIKPVYWIKNLEKQ